MKIMKTETNDKAVSTRIPTETWEWLTSIGTAGGVLKLILSEAEEASKMGVQIYKLSESLSELQMIRKKSQAELRGMFTPAEWSYMADSLNGTMVTPEFRCSAGALIANLQDSDEYNELGAKLGVDVISLCGKIEGLKGAQVDAVFSRVEAFWVGEGMDLEEWSMW